MKLRNLIDRLTAMFVQRWLLHVVIEGVHANTYVVGSIGSFAAEQKAKGRRLVIVNAWRISREDHRKLAAAGKQEPR